MFLTSGVAVQQPQHAGEGGRHTFGGTYSMTLVHKEKTGVSVKTTQMATILTGGYIQKGKHKRLIQVLHRNI